MLNQKELSILDFFNQHDAHYLKSKTIAHYLGVTEKTARKYIKQLNSWLDDEVAEVLSVPGHGFMLKVHDQKAYMAFYHRNKQALEEKIDITSIEQSKDRQYVILKKIFFEDEAFSIDEILIELAISHSTLLNDLKDINRQLTPYDLALKTSKKIGIYITGEEQKKRHFIMNYFFVERLQNNLRSLGEISKLLTTISSEEILLIVIDECRSANLTLSDTVILNIVTHIALALKRVEEGYQINFDPSFDPESNVNEYKAAIKIVNRLRKRSSLELPDEEIYNIALHLKNKRSKSDFSAIDAETQTIKDKIIAILRRMETESGLPLSEDQILLNGLIDHFSPFLTRLKNNNDLANPLLDEIKAKYSAAFELTKKHFSEMAGLNQFAISDDEWAYISLHVIAAMERNIAVEKKDTLVICATGLGSSQMLKVRLENEFRSKLNIVDVISYYQINDLSLKNIDLIVSSIDLSNVVFKIPVVNVSVLLNDKDIKAINQAIGAHTTMIKNTNPSLGTDSKCVIPLIDRYFDSELFMISEQVTDREEAIELLINQSIKFDQSINIPFLKRQLKLRERFSSVVFSDYVAIPHPLEGVCHQPCVAILITPKGISWDGKYEHIKLTMLMLPDRLGQHQLDEVSKMLLPLIEDNDKLQPLIESKDFTSFRHKLILQLTE
ncbi:BglG family transcription antiterminator [Amphibacillus jilinensis]|uniref:BglG family transcription antiterminator n=1 Tax=Amphibacillus jilinensis TaxID=1216008 RepID=UPI0002E403B2|nr:BglG family transcription antiterminator [Amphibacillus jilinensis]